MSALAAVDHSSNLYTYNGLEDITAAELFFWVFVDTTMQELGLDNLVEASLALSGAPILETRQKPIGAIKGTSAASRLSRRFIKKRFSKRILPTVVGYPPHMKIRLVNQLSVFVGRAVPVLGWILIARDVVVITYKATATYNRLAHGDDKLWD